MAQFDVSKALLHLAVCKRQIADLEALLQFLILAWALGTLLPLPAIPSQTPRNCLRWRAIGSYDTLDTAYPIAFGVFHHLQQLGIGTVLPSRYCWYDPPLPLRSDWNGVVQEEYVRAADVPDDECIPMSLQRRITEIHMLPLKEINGTHPDVLRKDIRTNAKRRVPKSDTDSCAIVPSGKAVQPVWQTILTS